MACSRIGPVYFGWNREKKQKLSGGKGLGKNLLTEWITQALHLVDKETHSSVVRWK